MFQDFILNGDNYSFIRTSIKPVKSSSSSYSSSGFSGNSLNMPGSGFGDVGGIMGSKIITSSSGNGMNLKATSLFPQQDLSDSNIALANALESQRVAERDLLKSRLYAHKISELKNEVENGNIGYRELIDKYKSSIGDDNIDAKLNIDALADEDNMSGRNTRVYGEQYPAEQMLGPNKNVYTGRFGMLGNTNGEISGQSDQTNGYFGERNLGDNDGLIGRSNGYQSELGETQNGDRYGDFMPGLGTGYKSGLPYTKNSLTNDLGMGENSGGVLGNGYDDPSVSGIPDNEEEMQLKGLKPPADGPARANLLKKPPHVIHALNADRMRYLSPDNHWQYRILTPGADKKILVITRDMQTGLTDFLTLKHLQNDCSTIDYFDFNFVRDRSGVYPFYTLTNKNVALGLEKNTLTAIPSNFDKTPLKFRQRGNLFEIMKDDLCLTRTFKEVEGIERLVFQRCGSQAQLFDLQEVLPGEIFNPNCHCSSCKDAYHTDGHLVVNHSGHTCHFNDHGCAGASEDFHDHFVSDPHSHGEHGHFLGGEHIVHPHMRSENFLHLHRNPHGHIEHLINTHGDVHHDSHPNFGFNGFIRGGHLGNPHGHFNHGYVLTPRHIH